jgi:hypothetical protein
MSGSHRNFLRRFGCTGDAGGSAGTFTGDIGKALPVSRRSEPIFHRPAAPPTFS